MPSLNAIVYAPSNLDFYGLDVVKRLHAITVVSRPFFGKHNAQEEAYRLIQEEADRQGVQAVINLRERLKKSLEGRWTCRLTGTVVTTQTKIHHPAN